MLMKQTNGAEVASHYQELKDRLHQRVIEMLDLTAINSMSQEAVTGQLTKLIEQLLQQESGSAQSTGTDTTHRTFCTKCWGWGRWSRCWRIRPSTTSS
jgi:hypothetical protein